MAGTSVVCRAGFVVAMKNSEEESVTLNEYTRSGAVPVERI